MLQRGQVYFCGETWQIRQREVRSVSSEDGCSDVMIWLCTCSEGAVFCVREDFYELLSQTATCVAPRGCKFGEKVVIDNNNGASEHSAFDERN